MSRPKVVLLSVPHSGTHFLQAALGELDLPYIAEPRQLRTDTDGFTAHFYTLGYRLPDDVFFSHTLLTPLRSPMDIALSTWQTAVSSRKDTMSAWAQLRDNLVTSWKIQQRLMEQLCFVDLAHVPRSPMPLWEFLLPWTKPPREHEKLMVDFNRAYKESREREYPLRASRDAYRIREEAGPVWDLMTGLDFLHYCVPYQKFYRFWWLEEEALT